TGNEDTHIVLRGGEPGGGNYSAQAVRAAVESLAACSLPPFVMVDCSHANSGRDPERQVAVAADLASRIADGERSVAAVMMESNLVGGSQDYKTRPLVYGRSVTD